MKTLSSEELFKVGFNTFQELEYIKSRSQQLVQIINEVQAEVMSRRKKEADEKNQKENSKKENSKK